MQLRLKMKRFLIKATEIILKPYIFFFLLGFLLINLWFSKGLLFGGTEVGVPTLTPGKILNQIIWIWWEALGPGVSFSAISASIPLYVFMTALEQLGLRAIDIQKILFFIIIYLQGIGACLLIKQIIPKIGKWQILCGLFYIFNPFMMTYIWHRFTYTNFILSAALPLLLYFYLQLLEKERFRYIFYFLIASFVSSYMYSAVAPVVAIWLAVSIIFITTIIMNRKRIKKVLRLSFFTLLLFLLWIAICFWWIYPLFTIKTIASSFFLRGNVNTLKALADKSTISYVARGINPYSLFLEKDWGSIYSTPIFQILSWIPYSFALVALLRRKEKKLWLMITLFLFGIFAAKGAAKPLGDFTTWFYANFFFLGVIRNSFEKLGLLVTIPLSILATVGIRDLWSLYKKAYFKILIILLIIGSGIYVWPMWSDKLFGSNKYPPYFTLPDDYPQVSQFLSKELKNDNGKILHLPITEGDSATYKWKYIYTGVELSSHLFPSASISKLLDIAFIDQMLKETARVFHTNNYNFQKQILTNFGVKYIVLNKNLDWYSRNIDNPLFVEKILDLSPDLSLIKETENLKVYKFIRQTNPEVFSKKGILLTANINSSNDYEFIWSNLSENEVFINPFKVQKLPQTLIQNEVILPRRIIINDKKPPEIITPKPFVKHLPDQWYFPLIIPKEKIELYFTPPYEKPMKMMLTSYKRLIEAQQLKERDKKQEFKNTIRQYSVYLDQTLNFIRNLDENFLDPHTINVFKIMLEEKRAIFQKMNRYVSDPDINLLIEQGIKNIDNFRKEKGFDIYYPYQLQEKLSDKDNMYTYQFITSEGVEKELIIEVNSPFIDKLENKNIKFFLDGVAKEITIKKSNYPNWFSLGKINLTPGIHEISLLVNNAEALIDTNDYLNINGTVQIEKEETNTPIKILSSKQESWIEYPIPNYDPDSTYIIEFNYQVLKGLPPELRILQESDNPGEKPKVVRAISENLYDFDEKYFALGVSTNQNASVPLDRSTLNPIVRLYLPFWNNCYAINYRNPKLCKNPEIRKAYNKESHSKIKNFQIRELFTGRMFLYGEYKNIEYTAPELQFKKISPVEYSVKVNNDNENLFLVLNEGFHSGWKVELNQGNESEIVNEDHHFLTNGYANGWLINKSGKFSLKIKFSPQDNLYKGVSVSLAFFVLASLIFLWELNRERITGNHNG